MDQPAITRHGILDCQVCVPESWTDDQAKEFVDDLNPTGLATGWSMRKTGDKYLAGAPERCPCEERKGFVHIMFDA